MDITLTPPNPDQPEQGIDASLAPGRLDGETLRLIDAYWRAANYLSVGQLYLYDNPLLREPLRLDHVKPLIVGHWGTTPGQNFIYVHLNRVIRARDLNMIYIAGPGHGGPALVGNTYLEGSYSEIYPDISQDEAGLGKLFRQFSFPGGISSHVAPTTPGSIHEGGELGYSLSHAFGAAFDNPGLIVACVIGDGEAETGPLATAWHSNKFLSPITDGAVLPILHLNGYKISNPTVLARIDGDDLAYFLEGCGWSPRFVEGSDPETMHRRMADVMDEAIADIRQFQDDARTGKCGSESPRWPVIVLRSPKGWTGPREVDGVAIEGSFRSHQVPLLVDAQHAGHVGLLESWLKSYRPDELFDATGKLVAELAAFAPVGSRRMGANPHANGGMLLRDLRLPDYRDYAVAVPGPGAVAASDMGRLGPYLRDVVKLNHRARNFRIFGPDETVSNMLSAVFEVTSRQWEADIVGTDESLAPSGMVLDAMLSEHQCQGWLEGYLLTGRHGIYGSYEAFIRIVDSMCSQHAKWLKVTSELPWRRDIASLNYLLSSHVWQQDHNGFTHQDPGFLDHVVNKKADIVRAYLPPDANCLLSVVDHCLSSRHKVNVVIAGKHAMPQWLSIEAAAAHCAQGIGIWPWASNDQEGEPDLVMACCGDTPTLEVLAAVSILRAALPEIRVRVVNVVDLMKLQPSTEHPHGLSDGKYDSLFTRDRPVVFAFHGYPGLIHRLTYHRANRNLHVRGYQEEGTITTAFDIRVQNGLDRFHLVIDAVENLPQTRSRGAYLAQAMRDRLVAHKTYIDKHGQDLPENSQLGLELMAGGRETGLPTVYLIRHGETAWSLTGQHTGHTDIPLTRHGETMAQDLVPLLASTRFAAVLTSPRQRASQTCAIAGYGREAMVEPDLVEWDYGDYEGMRTAEIRRLDPGWTVYRDGCPGGERLADVVSRADRVLRRVMAMAGPIALFSHAQFGSVLAARWVGLGGVTGEHLVLDPASISILGPKPGHPEVPVIARWNVVPVARLVDHDPG